MPKTFPSAFAVFALFVCALAARASVKVDINQDLDRKDILSPGMENWNIANGPSASRTFGDVTVSLRSTGGSGNGLATDQWRGGTDYNVRFASDGIFVRNGDNGGEIEMTLRGLSPGAHKIITWHNWLWDDAVSPFSIYVNGEKKLSGVQPSQRVTNEYNAASACVEVTAEPGKDIVLAFKPEGNGPIRNIIINGFAIDMPDPTKQAYKPTPATGDEHTPENTPLTWTPAQCAVAHQLYFGTDRQAVAAATPASGESKGKLTEPKFVTTGLNSFDTYYWRVDEIDASGNVTPGEVWSFRVRHLAFPEAEGYGRFAIGGRAGRVIEVTNLDDSGPGSLRQAMSADGPRTIVFRVGGTIHLKSKLVVTKPYCTIAGQTAPGEGIAVRGYTFAAGGTHDIIIRYMHVRIGDESGQTNDGSGFGSCDNCIMDHCSIAWSIDEGFSSRGARNITLQRSLITEPLNMSIHSHYVGTGKGHSFAGSISGDIGSFHHNLLANCAGRNWSLAGGLTRGGKFAGRLDIRNNVVYNWAHRTNDGGVKALNLVGNLYIPGPASRVFHLLLAIEEMKLRDDYQQCFVADNEMEGHPQYNTDNWQNGGVEFERDMVAHMKLEKPFCEPQITVQSPQEAYKSVLADVGANWPNSDSIDQRAIQNTRERTTTFKGSKTGIPGIIDSQKDVGEYPDLKGGEAPVDSDHDGIPDAWETAHGLNPHDIADGAKDSSGDGYTNLERYLNSIVQRKGKESMARLRQNLNRDWKFTRGDPAGAEAIDFDDSAWQSVGLPHTFDLPYFRTPEFYVGYGWYRKRLSDTGLWPVRETGMGQRPMSQKRFSLEFDGAFQVTEVFVNGRRVGEHQGGYTGFQFDITDFVQPGKNLLAVRVHNNWSPRIAPRAGEHIFSGGLYRDVHLVVTDSLYVPLHGITITTPLVSCERGEVKINTEIRNHSNSTRHGQIEMRIIGPNGNCIESRTSSFFVKPQWILNEQINTVVSQPMLWHPDHPHLYAVQIRIIEGDMIVDEIETPFGIRWFEWTADRGFFLNGEHLYLRGANAHQDHSGWGIAITQSACERDVRLIKQAGFNFVRGAHYPHHPAFADACDRLGLIFWSENAFWGKGGFGPEGYWNASAYPVNEEDFEPFEQSCKQQLAEMIRINRNHPSIMVWSMTNEAFFTYNLDRAKALMSDLVKLSRQLDPTRPAAIGGAQRGDVDKLGDIAGYNGDGARLFINPGVPNMVSEYGAISKPPDAYDPFFGDLQPERFPWRAGEAIWCAFDYGSIAGRQGLKGILDHARLPKQSWHWYRDHSLSHFPGTPKSSSPSPGTPGSKSRRGDRGLG